MPIKINLLAEQFAAEEAKRRDPMKRSISAGILLTILAIIYIGWKQLDVRAARQDFAVLTNKLAQIDEQSRLVKTNQALWMDTEIRLTSLNRFATNKFLWGNFLNALQQCAIPDIRLMRLDMDQTYFTNEPIKLLTTNLTAKYIAPPWKYNFWSEPKDPNYFGTVSNEFKNITNAGKFLTNTIQYTTKLAMADTNTSMKVVVVKAEWATVPFSIENTTVIIKGRDYGSPPGPGLDQFEKQIKAHPYFKELLQPGSQGFTITERPPMALSDPNDLSDPESKFIPFTIECRFHQRILTNE